MNSRDTEIALLKERIFHMELALQEIASVDLDADELAMIAREAIENDRLRTGDNVLPSTTHTDERMG